MKFRGLYGPVAANLQLDACGSFPVVIGQGGEVAPQVCKISGLYIESFSEIAPSAIWIGNVNGIQIERVLFSGDTVHSYNTALGPARVTNELVDGGLSERAIGDFYSTIPQRIIYVPSSAPSSGTILSGQTSLWVDTVGHKLMARLKLGNSVYDIELGGYTP